MSSKVITVYKTVQVSPKRMKTEVSDEYDDFTPAEYFPVTGTGSPCRVESYRSDDIEELGFRTQKEQEDLMIDTVHVEFDYVNWAYVEEKPELYKSSSPVPIRKTKKTLAEKKLVESERLAVAMRKMMRGDEAEPNSPYYDYWNRGYANVFDAEIRKSETWWGTERAERKRRLTWCYCETSCHWCVNGL